MKIRKTYFNQRKEHLISYMSSKDMDFIILEDSKDIYYLTGYLRDDYGWSKLRSELYILKKDGSEILITVLQIGYFLFICK